MNTTETRLNEVVNAMETKERTPGDESTRFYCFKDNASQEIKDIFLENFEIRDLDYEIFSKACDEISEIDLRDLEGSEFEGENASIYISDRLGYLNMWNEDEISSISHEIQGTISEACAYWYDEQVNSACNLLRAYIIGDINESTN